MGVRWDHFGTLFGVFFFETDFLSIFDSISGRAGGMGGRLPSLRICRTWDDLNHAATPAGVRRIN